MVVHLGLKHVESLVDGREINFLLIAVGALLLVFGYRYYRMSIYFAGFMFGAAPVFHWTQMFLRPFTCMSISLATGIMTAAVALEIEALGVLMLGAMWGLVITYLFNGIFLSRVGYAMCACNAPLYAAMGVLVPLCAAIAYQVHQPRKMAATSHGRKTAIFANTSTVGGYYVVRGIVSVIYGYPDEYSMALQPSDLPSHYWVALCCMPVVIVTGWMMQFKYTHYENCFPPQLQLKRALEEDQRWDHDAAPLCYRSGDNEEYNNDGADDTSATLRAPDACAPIGEQIRYQNEAQRIGGQDQGN